MVHSLQRRVLSPASLAHSCRALAQGQHRLHAAPFFTCNRPCINPAGQPPTWSVNSILSAEKWLMSYTRTITTNHKQQTSHGRSITIRGNKFLEELHLGTREHSYRPIFALNSKRRSLIPVLLNPYCLIRIVYSGCALAFG